MPLTGNFETFNLNSIFQLLSNEQKTGVLKVKNEEKEIRIFLKDGQIIYATGSQENERLGYFLKSSGTVSEEQLQAALTKSKAEKKRSAKFLSNWASSLHQNYGKSSAAKSSK